MPRVVPPRWRRPIRCACTTRRSSTITGWSLTRHLTAPDAHCVSIRACPGAHFVRAEALLLRGEWAEGWDEYEWRFRIGGAAPLMPPTSKPQWDGAALPDRTLLLVADQGFGDVIQFARYIPWAAERCPDIAIACSVEMRPLLHQIAPGVRAVRSLAGRARLRGVSAPCPACRGWRARASRTCLHRYPICARTRSAQRNGRSGWMVLCRVASAASA